MDTASNLTRGTLFTKGEVANTLYVARSTRTRAPLSPPLPRRAGANARIYAIRLLSDNFCAGPPPGASFVDGGAVALVLGPEACWQPRAFRLRRGRASCPLRAAEQAARATGSCCAGPRRRRTRRSSGPTTHNAAAQTIRFNFDPTLDLNTDCSQLGAYTTVPAIGVGSGPMMFSHWDPLNEQGFMLVIGAVSRNLIKRKNAGPPNTDYGSSLSVY
eukprot:g27083.t1